MKILLSAIAFLCLSPFHVFEKEIQESVNFLRKEKATVLEIKKASSTSLQGSESNKEALAIVFPELIRWSAFKDFFETKVLELMYISGGKSAADFSIGYFQMKPSFIENLEDYIVEHPSVQHLNFIISTDKNAEQRRSERVQRLQQLSWQLRYAHIYWAIANDLFRNKKFENAQERIRFFAAAYNYGFLQPQLEIEQWQSKIAFPYGIKYKGAQVVYADLSVEFYEKYANEF